ncbi:hypothetical protein B0H17DRAFT_1141368 [Mycena rosella]|uniref:Uncharacterized protein n=1 Tax=Mycena rosella TaxID=1033263 RepID=A0AAD7CZW7_MYCRO|nr:hypothetical protein B0H17DRAFT_1141368 [Mycena rosella]
MYALRGKKRPPQSVSTDRDTSRITAVSIANLNKGERAGACMKYLTGNAVKWAAAARGDNDGFPLDFHLRFFNATAISSVQGIPATLACADPLHGSTPKGRREICPRPTCFGLFRTSAGKHIARVIRGPIEQEVSIRTLPAPRSRVSVTGSKARRCGEIVALAELIISGANTSMDGSGARGSSAGLMFAPWRAPDIAVANLESPIGEPAQAQAELYGGGAPISTGRDDPDDPAPHRSTPELARVYAVRERPSASLPLCRASRADVELGAHRRIADRINLFVARHRLDRLRAFLSVSLGPDVNHGHHPTWLHNASSERDSGQKLTEGDPSLYVGHNSWLRSRTWYWSPGDSNSSSTALQIVPHERDRALVGNSAPHRILLVPFTSATRTRMNRQTKVKVPEWRRLNTASYRKTIGPATLHRHMYGEVPDAIGSMRSGFGHPQRKCGNSTNSRNSRTTSEENRWRSRPQWEVGVPYRHGRLTYSRRRMMPCCHWYRGRRCCGGIGGLRGKQNTTTACVPDLAS